VVAIPLTVETLRKSRRVGLMLASQNPRKTEDSTENNEDQHYQPRA
jgi:hypothetical protein